MLGRRWVEHRRVGEAAGEVELDGVVRRVVKLLHRVLPLEQLRLRVDRAAVVGEVSVAVGAAEEGEQRSGRGGLQRLRRRPLRRLRADGLRDHPLADEPVVRARVHPPLPRRERVLLVRDRQEVEADGGDVARAGRERVDARRDDVAEGRELVQLRRGVAEVRQQRGAERRVAQDGGAVQLDGQVRQRTQGGGEVCDAPGRGRGLARQVLLGTGAEEWVEQSDPQRRLLHAHLGQVEVAPPLWRLPLDQPTHRLEHELRAQGVAHQPQLPHRSPRSALAAALASALAAAAAPAACATCAACAANTAAAAAPPPIRIAARGLSLRRPSGAGTQL
mmetsp:Transcript_30551/g.98156  ORF Transcript_30551/g.98156 Transcript_30551/m.98156 type:complete len:333 (-) Transcript_30551:502-1500(-)